MKSLLIISPHFPPVNAADMHRVRQSVWYFEQYGWKPTVVCVNEKYVETAKDELLIKTLPPDLVVYKTRAFNSKWTRRLGLGALALRSFVFYFLKVNSLLKNKKYDLIYFSTTQFPVVVLGRYWKWRFNVPYIIDMQDPWHSDFYQNKPKQNQPPKYWFSYHLNKFLEPIAMKAASGIIAVSQGYCDMLQSRYKNITKDYCVVIPFGAFEKDFYIIANKKIKNEFFEITPVINYQLSTINCVYVGRGGMDMAKSLRLIFSAFKKGLDSQSKLFSRLRLYFIGTSYAPGGLGEKTIEPIAIEFDLQNYVFEMPDRIPYFNSLKLLMDADMLLVPGSVDPNYTASKLYPYIMAKKPLLAVFSSTSSVIRILKETDAGEFVAFNPDLNNIQLIEPLHIKWLSILEKLPYTPNTNWKAFATYTAKEMTIKQIAFFDKILTNTQV